MFVSFFNKRWTPSLFYTNVKKQELVWRGEKFFAFRMRDRILNPTVLFYAILVFLNLGHQRMIPKRFRTLIKIPPTSVTWIL